MFVILAFLIATCAVVQSLNFLAVGDWGGIEYKPYYTPGQKDSAKGMDKVAKALNAQFMLAVGDNFYHEGVTDESDSRFGATFEDVYTQQSLQFKWYAIAGNHDHKGNVSAQIAYSSHSSRWIYPESYHSHSFVGEDGATVDIVLIDTVDLSGMTMLEEHEPGYFDPLPDTPRARAEDQWTWLENTLRASTADHILVVGHYPVYSVCEHGNTANLITNLRPLLLETGAHYLSGHDHCMEHLTEPDGSVNYYLSGMGAYCCYKPSNKDNVPADTLKWYVAIDNRPRRTTAGFTSFTATKEGMSAIFYDQDGEVLYTAPAAPARAKKTA